MRATILLLLLRTRLEFAQYFARVRSSQPPGQPPKLIDCALQIDFEQKGSAGINGSPHSVSVLPSARSLSLLLGFPLFVSSFFQAVDGDPRRQSKPLGLIDPEARLPNAITPRALDRPKRCGISDAYCDPRSNATKCPNLDEVDTHRDVYKDSILYIRASIQRSILHLENDHLYAKYFHGKDP